MESFEESVGRMLEGMAQVGKRGQAPAQFVIGQVLEAGEHTLRVVCGGQELGREDLWVNEALLAPGGRALARGDRVVLLTEDGQDYYLICKAVRP